MEKSDQINIVIGAALLFTIITSIVSLISNSITIIFLSNGGFNNRINVFIKNNILYILVIAIIIFSLIVYMKKTNQRGCLYVLRCESTCLITGVFLILQGILDLSSILPIYIRTILPLLKLPQSTEKSMEIMSGRIITADVISVALVLCQILVGVYLLKCYKKKIN